MLWFAVYSCPFPPCLVTNLSQPFQVEGGVHIPLNPATDSEEARNSGWLGSEYARSLVFE